MTRTPAPTTASSVAPPPETASTGLAARLTSRWGARVAVLLFVLATILVSGAMRSAEVPPRGDAFPGSAESAVVAERLTHFPDAGRAPVLLVGTRDDGGRLTADDVAAMTALGDRPQRSEDGRAVVVTRDVTLGRDGSETAETVRAIRADVAAAAPDGLTVQVTGGPAFGADLASSFDGANVTLLLVTIGVVALLLLLTYRSPILWILPLTVVAVADQVAGRVTAAVGQASGLSFDAGIVSVLVFGAGTNYALLLISRYRDELRHAPETGDGRRAALATATRATAHAVVASATTVVVGVLTLLLSVFPTTRGLGLACAVGIVVAAVFALIVLPAVLSLFGRWIFWPRVPHDGEPGADTRRSLWHRVGTAVRGRPGAFAAATTLLLVLLAAGLGWSKLGLPRSEQFLARPEALVAADRLAEHFPAGASDPASVVTTADAREVTAAIKDVEGVSSVTPVASGGGVSELQVVLDADPASPAAAETVTRLRETLTDHPGSHVGGSTAEDLDTGDGTQRDRLVVLPLILALVLGALVLLLRSLAAPLILVATVVATYLAALGASWWIFAHVFGFSGIVDSVPLLAFLFLVALGVDYNIFLVTRALEESRSHGHREGMLRALSATGGVITSAGILLAAVFAVLGVLPLVVLAQLGTVICVGVLLDTLLVRTVLVPAIAWLMGERFWWPRKV